MPGKLEGDRLHTLTISTTACMPINEPLPQRAVRVVSSYQDEQPPWCILRRKAMAIIAAALILVGDRALVAGFCATKYDERTPTQSPETPTNMFAPTASPEQRKPFQTTQEIYGAVDIYIEYLNPDAATRPEDSRASTVRLDMTGKFDDTEAFNGNFLGCFFFT